METNLKRLERLKTIRMPELSNQSADFQDCFEVGCKQFLKLCVAIRSVRIWPDLDALDDIKAKISPYLKDVLNRRTQILMLTKMKNLEQPVNYNLSTLIYISPTNQNRLDFKNLKQLLATK